MAARRWGRAGRRTATSLRSPHDTINRRRFLTLFGLTGGGITLLLPATKTHTATIKIDVTTMKRDGDIITVETKR